MNDFNHIETFRVDEPKPGKYVKIRQTFRTYGGDKDCAIAAFEIFGTVKMMNTTD